MANASRWPLSVQMGTLSAKGVSVMGLLMESLMESLTRRCSGAPIEGWGWPRVAEASAVLSPLQVKGPYSKKILRMPSCISTICGSKSWSPTSSLIR